VLQGNLSIPSEQTDPATALETVAPHSSLAGSINTIQADLYFESATGYGKWRLLCSGICLSNLARDGVQSEPVLRRLQYVPLTSLRNRPDECLSSYRELSSGCFSETNQKRLTKDSPIDIYRARLPGSVRLVVSCCLDFPVSGILMLLQVSYRHSS
jgi:hypothetical protein